MTKSIITFTQICEYCKQEFIAFTSTTKYCSHTCNSRHYKLKKRLATKKIIDEKNQLKRDANYTELNSKPYLTIRETAQLLGVCNKTIYNLIYSGRLKATKLSSRLTIISKEKINFLFSEVYNYKKMDRPLYNMVDGFYTIVEIKDKYNLKERRIWKIIKDNDIPTTKIGKFSHISKKHIDNYFGKHPSRNKIINTLNNNEV
ncbi:helix-turn-helix domain-containing protein [Parabacteroides sp. FAFU027]|uniref:helix-turn-helix domain-containing protein n=1 Tax=Parabacteroides sp. FAFU027 TaxID=2922715 RepID=UPI001FAF5BA3|nr:helix-turn-helix domain-containing protein [Parabacteroides sp. FAFU027]